jgi:methyl-accepting chemotaxis protein
MLKHFTIGKKIVFCFVLATIPSLVLGFFAVQNLRKIPIPKENQKTAEFLSPKNQCNARPYLIRYYDEVLTQSVRNFAFTENSTWESRYRATIVKMDETITEALVSSDQKDKKLLDGIRASNIALQKSDENLIDFVAEKEPEKAIDILESSEYIKQKEAGKKILDEYMTRHDAECQPANAAPILAIKKTDDKTRNIVDSSIFLILKIMVLGFFAILALGAVCFFVVTRPIKKLEKTMLDIANGDENKRSSIRSHDEIGTMAQALNRMMDAFQRSKTEMEAKMAELKELELKMTKIKKELSEQESGETMLAPIKNLWKILKTTYRQ